MGSIAILRPDMPLECLPNFMLCLIGCELSQTNLCVCVVSKDSPWLLFYCKYVGRLQYHGIETTGIHLASGQRAPLPATCHTTTGVRIPPHDYPLVGPLRILKLGTLFGGSCSRQPYTHRRAAAGALRDRDLERPAAHEHLEGGREVQGAPHA